MKEKFISNNDQNSEKPKKKSKFRNIVEKAAVYGTAAVAFGGAMEVPSQPVQAQEKEYTAKFNPKVSERIATEKKIKVYQQLGYENTRNWEDNYGNKYSEFVTPKGKEIIMVPLANNVTGPKEKEKPFKAVDGPSTILGPDTIAGPDEIKQ